MISQTARSLMDIAPDVEAALARGGAVVALESSIITHGMPYPQNGKMAARVEQIIREEGAVPATIAVLDGRLKIGLSSAELERLTKAPSPMSLVKGELAFALVQKRTGGTTVNTTMIAAHLAGIRVFATGGIGGVHKGAETSFDISADLPELARTPVIVVAAGAKAILDIGKTLEALETLGVPVIGYRCDVMPAFWSRTSQFPVLRLDSVAEIVRLSGTAKALGLNGGMLIANPVPAESEIDASAIGVQIAMAQDELKTKGISGKPVTPYLLSRILELTSGASLATNIALVENNARLASAIARELCSG